MWTQGQKDYVISARRQSHVLSTLGSLQTNVAGNTEVLRQGGSYQVRRGRMPHGLPCGCRLCAFRGHHEALARGCVASQLHGGGSSQAASYIRDVMAELQSQARAPIQATYRCGRGSPLRPPKRIPRLHAQVATSLPVHF